MNIANLLLQAVTYLNRYAQKEEILSDGEQAIFKFTTEDRITYLVTMPYGTVIEIKMISY